MEVRDHDPLICEAIKRLYWAGEYRRAANLSAETANTWNMVAKHNRGCAANALRDWLCACDAE